MKKTLAISIGLLTILAFATAAMAQGQAKPAASPIAPASEKSKAEDTKVMKKEEAPAALEASGAVMGYEAKKMIKVKEKDKEMVFEVTGETKIKGEIKEGAPVTVMYKQDGNKMIASTISAGGERKADGKKAPPAEKKS
jgi:hypothetical protein